LVRLLVPLSPGWPYCDSSAARTLSHTSYWQDFAQVANPSSFGALLYEFPDLFPESRKSILPHDLFSKRHTHSSPNPAYRQTVLSPEPGTLSHQRKDHKRRNRWH